MKKSVKREYELDRAYDYDDDDAYGFKNIKANVGFVKKRAHKRLRQQNEQKGKIYEDCRD